MSNKTSRGLIASLTKLLKCVATVMKLKTQNTYRTYKIIILVIIFLNFEQLLPGRIRKDIFLTTNLSRRIFVSPACVLFYSIKTW